MFDCALKWYEFPFLSVLDSQEKLTQSARVKLGDYTDIFVERVLFSNFYKRESKYRRKTMYQNIGRCMLCEKKNFSGSDAVYLVVLDSSLVMNYELFAVGLAGSRYRWSNAILAIGELLLVVWPRC